MLARAVFPKSAWPYPPYVQLGTNVWNKCWYPRAVTLLRRSSRTRPATIAAYCCGGKLLLTSCRVFVLTDSLWKPHLGNHGVKLSKFLMRNAKQNTARCCRSEEGYRCMAGSGRWLNSQEREHICVQDLLWLLPHIIREMKQHQHRCVAEGYGSRFDTFSRCFIARDACCATQKSSSGTLFDMKQFIKAVIRKRKYYTREMLIVLRGGSLSALKEVFSYAFGSVEVVDKGK